MVKDMVLTGVEKEASSSYCRMIDCVVHVKISFWSTCYLTRTARVAFDLDLEQVGVPQKSQTWGRILFWFA